VRLKPWKMDGVSATGEENQWHTPTASESPEIDV